MEHGSFYQAKLERVSKASCRLGYNEAGGGAQVFLEACSHPIKKMVLPCKAQDNWFFDCLEFCQRHSYALPLFAM